MTLRFGVLGPLEVWSDGEMIPIRGARRRGLLAYLLAHTGEPQSPDRIVDAVWGEAASTGSERTVQTYASQLRKLFGEQRELLVHRAGGYVLDLDVEALDASRFEVAVAAASGLDDMPRRLTLLDEALALWRGTPLNEFAGQAWADERARQWTRMHVLAHQLRAAALLDDGRHHDALPALEQLVAAHPLHEPFWAQLIVARYRCGQQADALAAVSEARKVLATELGIEPGPELVALERDVLAQAPSLDAPRLERRPIEKERIATVVEPLPDGVVTFFLTDIVRSSELWDQHPDEMAKGLVRHEDVIADVVHAHNGRLLKSRGEGDATLSVFLKATDAVAAAVALQRRLQNEPWPGGLDLATRVALHTGEAHLRDGDYYGGTVNRAARIRALAVGGQILVSRAVHDLVVDVLAVDLEFVGFGEHEMKGLQRRENVYEIRGPGLAERLLVSREEVIARPRTSFVGRANAIEEIEAVLRDRGLVTLVGPGGIGKTRLALETSAHVGDQFDRVCVAELASVFEAEAVVSEIASAVGAGSSVDAIGGIIQAISRDRTLVVIDNCEHLIDECARVIDSLTRQAPALTVLATSRIPTEILGEVVVAVEPLAGADAVRLLGDRAGRTEDGPADRDAFFEIARRLDGIPLALELTGARLRSMSATDLVARLPVLDATAKRPATERHATMRAALDWSYELLSEKERAVLRRLAVFAGFTIEAAEQVVVGSGGDALAESDEISELIGELVAHSMVVFDAGAGRYRLLEPVRQYATDLLERSGESGATWDRHARYFAATAERVGRAMAAGQLAQTALDDDLNNIEGALNWADQRQDDETLCRIVGALGVFWYSTSTPQGVRWARRAVARRRDVALTLWASVLLVAGQMAQTRLRDDPDAAAWLDEAVAAYRELGRERALGWALFWQARFLAFSDPSRAQYDLEEALVLFQRRDDALGSAWALYWLGSLALEAGHDDLFFALAEQLQELAAARVPALLGLALSRAAYASYLNGDTASALAYIATAEEHQREDGDRYNLVGLLFDRAWLESKIGSRERTFSSLRDALELDRRIGAVDEGLTAVRIADILINAGAPTEARALLGAADALEKLRLLGSRWSRERAIRVEERLDLSGPPVKQFADYTAALDWVLQWISEQLERNKDEVEVEVEVEVETARPSSLVGRTDAIARISDAIDQPGCVTLVGPGGIGKTTLLEDACTRFADRFERVWRIDLVGARDRAGVESLFEVALLPDRDPMAQSTDTARTPDFVTEIVAQFGGRRVLVALDNCEQLTAFLPDIAEALLAKASGLTVLATSREPLEARGEIVLPVVSLMVPSDDSLTDPSRLGEVESVELLITRARERGADVAITLETAEDIASICRQLDGIPLAIELAAARLPSTSPADLAVRLSRQLDLLAARHGEARHRSLRSAIDWSYELLEPSQQVLLRRLGIFVGGFTLDTAEEVCSFDLDVLATSSAVYLNLAELVAKSVVVFDREQSRYRMLEPIRQFARELLESSGELPRVADQHARWAFRNAFEASSGTSMQQRFEVELDNVHAALGWLCDNEPKRFLRFVSILGYCWCFIDWRRGRAVTEVAVTMATDVSERLRAGVFLTRGIVEQHQDAFGSSLWLNQARDLYLRTDDPVGVAWSTFFLAGAYAERDPAETRRLFLECVDRFHDLGAATGEMWALLNLVHLAQDQGRIDEAADHLERMDALARRFDQTSLHGVVLALHARNTASRGDADAAGREMREAIELQEANDERYNLQQTLSDAAWIELQADRVSVAEDYVRWALRLGLEIEHERGLRLALVVLAVVEARRGNDRRARSLIAATGWDLHRPDTSPYAVHAEALKELEYLDNDGYEAAAHEGRALGVFGAARAFAGEQRDQPGSPL
jgi:predicted ATPase/DNA-binding SARP family transcriptional activator